MAKQVAQVMSAPILCRIELNADVETAATKAHYINYTSSRTLDRPKPDQDLRAASSPAAPPKRAVLPTAAGIPGTLRCFSAHPH